MKTQKKYAKVYSIDEDRAYFLFGYVSEHARKHKSPYCPLCEAWIEAVHTFPNEVQK